MAVPPRLVRPMTAALRRGLPADQDRYGWEFKWDEVRAIASSWRRAPRQQGPW
jgi:hypothetical protein